MAPAVHHRSPPPRHSHHVSDSRTRPRRDEASWSRSPPRTERKGTARSSDRGEASKSPSPRTKRLRRAVGEKDESRSSRTVRKERSGSPVERRRRDKSGSPVERRRRDRSGSPVERARRDRRSSGSPVERERRRRQNSVSPSRREKRRNGSEADHPGDSEQDSLAKMKAAEEALTAKQKEKPSFELSGKLAEETNRFRGVTLLFTEPVDARKPDIRWRLYVFKAGEVLNDPLYVHRQSCYLFGRERRVADIPTDHPSCSKQHAIIQYRVVEKEQPDGMMKKQVRPYLMDLGSTNGTFLNDNPLEPQRYYELFEKDTIKFGNSSREYVLLHENSAQ